VAADLPVFIVEMYSPGEIVDSRRSFSAESIEAALADAKRWINDTGHNATSFRVVDLDGATLFDKLVTDFA
jgi:flavin-binding protein dodecin